MREVGKYGVRNETSQSKETNQESNLQEEIIFGKKILRPEGRRF